MNNDAKYTSMFEVLINIFTVDKGILKVVLFKKNTNPYKGYWMLPSSLLFADETIESAAEDTILNMVGYKDIYTELCNVYSAIDRIPDKRVIGCSLVGIVDSAKARYKREEIHGFESEWFDINEIPKTVGDHGIIIEEAIDFIRKRLLNSAILKCLFPSDFTFPELQKVYEQVLGKELDRRNFRKKMLNLDMIELTGDKNVGFNGRPANLYRFKSDIKEREIF